MENQNTVQRTGSQGTEQAVAPLPTTNIEMGTIPTTTTKKDDPYLVTFEEPFDADNPK